MRRKKWPVQMNLPFFRCKKAYVPGRGGGASRIRPKKIRKMPSGRYRYKNLLLQILSGFARISTKGPICRPWPDLTYDFVGGVLGSEPKGSREEMQ